MKLPATGSCQCGNVSYRVSEEPLAEYACHCRECQKLSTSAFSVSMILRSSGFELVSGELKQWERPTDSGDTAVCWFCPDCGNRIYHESPAMPGVIRFKPGTLDDTSQLDPKMHVWTCREQPWLSRFAELPRHETQPDIAQALADIAQGKQPF